MKRLAALCACVCAAFVAAAPASADLAIGVADDGGKLSDDGGAWFISQFKAVGLQENRITIAWNPDAPTTIPDKERLDAYLANATAAGIRVMILIAPNRARALTGSAGSTGEFVRFVAQVARSYPQVKDFGVGNEPNQPRFWQPQFSSSGRALACGAYERVLAQAYDALKDVDRNITVIGVSLQDAASHQQFIDKYKLPFDLAVDSGGAVAKAFHVPVRGEYASRQTFLIGPDGRIKKICFDVKPSGHAAEILAAAKS